MRFCKYVLLVVFTTLFISGCSFLGKVVYRPDINQGNYITDSNIGKLQIGQSKEQVLYIMGTPMLYSIFGDNIWYYVFRQQQGHGQVKQSAYTLIFNESERLAEVKIDHLQP